MVGCLMCLPTMTAKHSQAVLRVEQSTDKMTY